MRCSGGSGVNALSVCVRLTGLRGSGLRDKAETAEGNAFGSVYEARHTFVSRDLNSPEGARQTALNMRIREGPNRWI